MKSIPVQPYKWEIYNFDKAENKTYEIHAWCLDRESKPILVRVQNFPILAHMLLDTHDPSINWTNELHDYVLDFLNTNVFEYNKPKEANFVTKYRLQSYSDRRWPMSLLSFSDKYKLKKVKSILENPVKIPNYGFMKFRILEDDISEICKLLAILNIEHSQWFIFDGELQDPIMAISKITEYVVCDWKTLMGIDASVTETWITHPYILSWDSEVYSANHDAFPRAEIDTDEVYLITMTLQRQSLPETKKKIAILYGDAQNVKDCTVIKVATENQLIDTFCDIIEREDPDIDLGYNTMNFDWKYIYNRDSFYSSKFNRWNRISRLKNSDVRVNKNDKKGSEKFFLEIPGRITFDMFLVIKKEHKLINYKLDTVAKKFLNRGKLDMLPKEMFIIRSKYLNNMNNLDECTDVLRYAIEDADLVIDLFERLGIWYSLIEMSNINGVNISDLYVRGQQIRCINLLYKECLYNETVMEQCIAGAKSYKGGHVAKPIVGYHENLVTMDYQGLYPSIMRAYNVCYTTYVPKEYTWIKDEDCNVFEWVDDVYDDKGKKVIGQINRRERFIKTEHKPGLIPKILERLTDGRGKAKKRLKEAQDNGDEVMASVFNARQNALKFTSNSFYGFMGVADKGKYPFVQGAAYVTARGRVLINFVNEYLIRTYGARIIYNDTDSSMIDMDLKSVDCHYWGRRISEEITKQLPKPIFLTFEKAMNMLAIQPKMYAYYEIRPDGTVETDPKNMNVKGIPLARRDNCPFVIEIYRKILINIFNKGGFKKTLQILVNAVNNLLSDQINWKDLIMIREMGKDYKSDNYMLNAFQTKMREEHKIIEAGTRIEFLICDIPGETAVGRKMVLVDDYINNNNSNNTKNIRIDRIYYIEHYMNLTYKRLIFAGHNTEIMNLGNVGYKPKGRCHFIGIKNPIGIIHAMIRDNVPIDNIFRLLDQKFEPRFVIQEEKKPRARKIIE